MAKYALVDAQCQECGAIVKITSNVTGRFKRCPICRAERKKQTDRESDEREKKEREEMGLQLYRNLSDYNIGGEYHITLDPDESWAADSSFTWDEIERMLNDGYLAVGTEFRVEPNQNTTHRVVCENGNLHLRSIAELNKKKPTVPKINIAPRKSIPYWRKKKLWHSISV